MDSRLLETWMGRRQYVEEKTLWRGEVTPNIKSHVTGSEIHKAERDQEVGSLRLCLKETQTALDSTREDLANLLESLTRELEDQKLQHAKQLAAKEEEIDALRSRQNMTIQELVRGARETLEELETQLETAKLSEGEALVQLTEAQKEIELKTSKMKDLEVLLEKMCQELDQVKGKWKSTKHAHGKVVEEKELWKKYAEKIEDERKSNQRGLELERKVFNKLTQIETLLKSEKQHQNILLRHLDSFGSDLISEVRSLQSLKQTQTDKIWKQVSETQTDAPDEDTSVLKILEQDNAELQDKLNKTECELQAALLQNSTLRGVILKMKSDRENLDRAKELEEEDARVSKLEDSVRLIKNNFVNGQNEVCICSALQDVQKEIACLKNKNVVSNIATPRPLKPAFTRKKILNV